MLICTSALNFSMASWAFADVCELEAWSMTFVELCLDPLSDSRAASVAIGIITGSTLLIFVSGFFGCFLAFGAPCAAFSP